MKVCSPMVGSKSILTVSAVAFALMFGGGAYILLNLNALAKPITERIATKALGTKVSIGSMDINLQDKRVDTKNIRIANMPGYKKPHIITIDNIGVALNTASKELVDFKDITVNGTNAYLEVTPEGTNLQDLQKRVKAVKQNKDTPNALKVIIDRIQASKATLHPSVTLLGQQDLAPVTIPTLTLRGIGKKENGVLADEAIAQIMSPLLKSASKAANGAGFYEGLSADTLKELGESQLQGFKNQIGKELGVNVDEVTKGLKGLFE